MNTSLNTKPAAFVVFLLFLVALLFNIFLRAGIVYIALGWANVDLGLNFLETAAAIFALQFALPNKNIVNKNEN